MIPGITLNAMKQLTIFTKRLHKTILPSSLSIQTTLPQKQTHLTPEQRNDLAVLLHNTKLLSGKLGVYPARKLHFKLIDNATLVHSRPYSVLFHQHELFKNELDRLVKSIGVFEPCDASEWLMPTFIVPQHGQHCSLGRRLP